MPLKCEKHPKNWECKKAGAFYKQYMRENRTCSEGSVCGEQAAGTAMNCARWEHGKQATPKRKQRAHDVRPYVAFPVIFDFLLFLLI